MLYQPEFEDVEKLKQLMNMLEDRNVWRDIGNQETAIAVRTNRGAELTWIDDVAIVRSKFKGNEHDSGQLMVVGPSRMQYEKIVAMIDYAAGLIEKMYMNQGGDDSE